MNFILAGSLSPVKRDNAKYAHCMLKPLKVIDNFIFGFMTDCASFASSLLLLLLLVVVCVGNIFLLLLCYICFAIWHDAAFCFISFSSRFFSLNVYGFLFQRKVRKLHDCCCRSSSRHNIKWRCVSRVTAVKCCGEFQLWLMLCRLLILHLKHLHTHGHAHSKSLAKNNIYMYIGWHFLGGRGVVAASGDQLSGLKFVYEISVWYMCRIIFNFLYAMQGQLLQ